MRVLMCVVVSVLLLPLTGQAWDAVCSGVRPNCANTTGMSNYLQNRDLEQIPGPACTALPNDHVVVAQQKQLIRTVSQSHVNGLCHLKVVAGLAVEMSSIEKDSVNAAIQAEQDERQAYEDLAQNNDLCNATRQQLEAAKNQVVAALQGDIAAITNIDTLKVELTDIVTRLINNDYKLMTCIRGRVGPPPPP